MAIPSFRKDGWLPTGHYSTTLDEVVERFRGVDGSRRRIVTERLIWLCQGLERYGVKGYLVLNGGYISAKEEPKDFDVLLVAEPGVDALKEANPSLAEMLDPQLSEDRNYSILYCQTNSFLLDDLKTLWDRSKETGVEKGVLEVPL